MTSDMYAEADIGALKIEITYFNSLIFYIY